MFFNCYVYCYFGLKRSSVLPCEQRLLSCMAFTVSEVIRVACLSCSWYVYAPTRQTSHVNVFVNGKSHARAEKVPLALAGYL